MGEPELPASQQKEMINDFSLTFGTVNGSGSATANVTLLRAIFAMGIPVSGKNIFPSNIQGLPTWYTIRVNQQGFVARMKEDHIVVAMNPASFTKDLESVVPGGVFFYADDIRQPITRQDVHLYPMPVKKLSQEADFPANLKEYIANMVYVGVVAQILGISMKKIHSALDFHFRGKQKAVEGNYAVAKAAADWAAANLKKTDPYILREQPPLDGYIMADGNTAAALGSIYGGVQFIAWYPITPASSLAENLNEYLPKLRTDPKTGKNTFAIMQAEDELAAVGMAIGAGWAGLRAMTSTSGPGFSLMTEYAGLAYYAEVPVVIWDVQRVGPSTGLPTRTAQGEIRMAATMGHGDVQHIVLIPGSVNECFEFGWKSFDLAERLQTPVMVLSDLDFGMNQWMTPKFEYPDRPMDRGKILTEADLERLSGEWGRYKDVDGDGIPWRTLPGNHHPRSAYFARGTGHDEYAHYSEDPDVWFRMMERLKKKFETAKQYVPAPVIERVDGARIGIIAYGSTHEAVKEARYLLEADGIQTNYMRLRALPFTAEVKQFIQELDRVYVVEMNRDGQMHAFVQLECPEKAASIRSLSYLDGLPLTAKWIKSNLLVKEENHE
jgi:2-oxoglutarate ferredoxin oxidoreductase subunit alpha